MQNVMCMIICLIQLSHIFTFLLQNVFEIHVSFAFQNWEKLSRYNFSVLIVVQLFLSALVCVSLHSTKQYIVIIFCTQEKETSDALKLFYCLFLLSSVMIILKCNIPNTTNSLSSHFLMPRRDLKVHCTAKYCSWIFKVFGIARKDCLMCFIYLLKQH